MKMVDIEAVRNMLAIQWGYEGIEDDIDNLPTIDAIPIGCLELEKADCSFSDQCDMGSSYTRERERACKNIIEWWKTPSYQKCLSVATERGFVSKKW